MSEFHFARDTHVYTLDGEVIPSLSEVLRPITEPLYSNIPDQQKVEEARENGVQCHLDTERFDRGDCDEYESKATEAWAAFREATGFAPTHIEYSTYHPVMRYGTTIDRLGSLADGSVVLIDIKTGSSAKWHRLQTAGQLLALHHQGICDRMETARYNVVLNKDGTFKVVEHPNNAVDIKHFLVVHGWPEVKEEYL
jgi:hypothetical protein